MRRKNREWLVDALMRFMEVMEDAAVKGDPDAQRSFLGAAWLLSRL